MKKILSLLLAAIMLLSTSALAVSEEPLAEEPEAEVLTQDATPSEAEEALAETEEPLAEPEEPLTENEEPLAETEEIASDEPAADAESAEPSEEPGGEGLEEAPSPLANDFTSLINAELTANGIIDGALIQSMLYDFGCLPDSYVVNWAASKFFDALLGGVEEKDDGPDYMTTLLQQVIANQTEIQALMKDLGEKINNTEYNSILNRYLTDLNASAMTQNLYRALRNIDLEFDGRRVDGVLSPEDEALLTQMRLSALTYELGVSRDNPGAVGIALDNALDEMYALLTTTYFIQVGMSTQTQADMLGVFYEKERTAYNWEHQAYDEINKFNDFVVANYLMLSAFDLASVEARIELCEQAGVFHTMLNARRDILLDRVNGLHNDAEDVTGIHELYDQHKPTDPRRIDYYYFWVPDYELKLSKTVRTTSIPTEIIGNCKSDFDDTKGFADKELTDSFWDPTWLCHVVMPGEWRHYEYDYKYGLDSEDVNKLLGGCGYRMTLEEILADAGFEGVPENGKMLLPRDDSLNPMKVDYHSSTSVSYYEKSWSPRLYAVSLTQKDAVTAGGADTVQTYEYWNIHARAGLTSKTTWKVEDYREKAPLFMLVKYCEHKWTYVEDGQAPGKGDFYTRYRCDNCGSIRTFYEDPFSSYPPVPAPMPTETPEASEPTSPKTGDTMMPVLWLGAMLASAAALSISLRRKKHSSR